MAHTDDPAPGTEPLLAVRDLVVTFPAAARGELVQAVSGVSFTIDAGETLGLVGESGCGKSSVARAVLQLPPPSAGSVRFEGVELTDLDRRRLRALRRRMQPVFQDPVSSLNPRRSVRDIVAEPLAVGRRAVAHRAVAREAGDGRPDVAARRKRAGELLAAVGIDPALGHRRPHQFSGGQCQRIGIARALAGDPRLLICDEPVSALDVSVQAQLLNLFEDLKEQRGLTMLFISHDLSVVRNISDRVAVMYLGTLCEVGETTALYDRPAHPYTRALLDAAPIAPPVAATRHARPVGCTASSSAVHPPSGCRFRTRCPQAQARCAEEVPVLTPIDRGAGAHAVACHFPLGSAQEPV
ncbi:MAG: ATP-binding cassette domain-containing protein [Acidimicrobiales bacterium]